MKSFYITFDTEDFVNPKTISAIDFILDVLDYFKIRGLFFITGHMAEKISENDNILDKLDSHLIGYHSSSHSVRPTIIEYTDLESYQSAYEASIQRETSHIDWYSGEPDGIGGILKLREVFPKHQINSYRSPGDSWSTPHLEALRDLGIIYNFTSNISNKLIKYSDIFFYPKSFIQSWSGTLFEYQLLLLTIIRNNTSVFDIHPWWLVYKQEWDRIFWEGNPKQLKQSQLRNINEINDLKRKIRNLFKILAFCQKKNFIKITPNLGTEKFQKCMNINDHFSYDQSVRWSKKYFNYKPKYLHKHFKYFFEL